jgi:hypothetical protein
MPGEKRALYEREREEVLQQYRALARTCARLRPAVRMSIMARATELLQRMLLMPPERRVASSKNDKKLSPEDWQESCVDMFRFRREDIYRLHSALKLPHELPYGTPVRHADGRQVTKTIDSLEGLLILLHRLATKKTADQVGWSLGVSETTVNEVFVSMLQALCSRWQHLLRKASKWLGSSRARLYEEVQRAKVPSMPGWMRLWGAIDGHLHKIPMPTGYWQQRACFSGHKRFHALRFLAVATPDGLCALLFGPIEGKRADGGILADSGLYEQLRALLGHVNYQQQEYLVGDSAFRACDGIIPLERNPQSAGTQALNRMLAQTRVYVEQVFGQITTTWPHLCDLRTQKLLSHRVGAQFTVAALLYNCRVCLYGNAVTCQWDCEPPSLEEYLQ